MSHADELTPDPNDYVFAKPGELYAVYLPDGGSADLDLSTAKGDFEVKWYDPRYGGELKDGSVKKVQGGARRNLGEAPRDRTSDWAILVRPARQSAPSLDRERNFHVKLRTPIGNRISKPGDRIEASVIGPESFLGGALEGVVENVTANSVTLSFRSLVHKGARIAITSATRDFVNSKGHKLLDDDGRAARMDNTALTSAAGRIRLDEGAELYLRVSPRQ